MHVLLPPWVRHGGDGRGGASTATGASRSPFAPNPALGSQQNPTTPGASVFSVDIQPNGDRLATAGQDAAIKLWSLSILARFAEPHPGAPGAAAAAPTPPSPPPHSHSQGARGRRAPEGALLASITAHAAAVNVVRWSPCGTLLASGGDDAVVLVYERVRRADGGGGVGGGGFGMRGAAEDWRARRPLRAHAADVVDVCWSPDGERLASASVDNSVGIWSVREERLVTRLSGHTGLVKGVAWDPVGRFLASQSDDRSLVVWRTADWTRETVLTAPFEEAVFRQNANVFYLRCAWSPCGSQLVATNGYKHPVGDIAPMFSRTSGFQKQVEMVGHKLPVVSVRFSPRLYRMKTEQVEARANGVALGGSDVARETDAPDGGDGTDVHRKGDAGKNACRRTDKVEAGALPAYTCLALGSKDTGASVWQARSQHCFFHMNEIFSHEVIDLSWGSDGYTLVACSPSGEIIYVRFDASELGTVVPRTEEREILAEQWRAFGGTRVSDALPETPAILSLARKMQNGVIDADDLTAPANSRENTCPTANREGTATDAVGSADVGYVHTTGPAPSTRVTTQDVSGANGSPANLEANRGTEQGPERPANTSIPEREHNTKQQKLQQPVGRTPPADAILLASQKEVRARGGKRRIIPATVASVVHESDGMGLSSHGASSLLRQQGPQQMGNISGFGTGQGGNSDVGAEVVAVSGRDANHAPAKRQRTGVTFSNGVDCIGRPVSSGSDAGSHPVIGRSQRTRDADWGGDLGDETTQYEPGTHMTQSIGAPLAPGPIALPPPPMYKPSIIGLSMALLPDSGMGPGRCRALDKERPPTMLEAREQHSGSQGGGYIVTCSKGGTTLWRDYYPLSSVVTVLAGVAGKFAAVGTADGFLIFYSAASGRRLMPPIALDCAAHTIEAHVADVREWDGEACGQKDQERWFALVVTRSGLCNVYNVRSKKLICARSAVALLARAVDGRGTPADGDGSSSGGVHAEMYRTIAEARVTQNGEPILVLSDSHVYFYSKDMSSWLRVADDATPNSEFLRVSARRDGVGIVRSLQAASALSRPAPSLSGMGDLRRSAVETLVHLETMLESAIALSSPQDYRYYLAGYAAKLASAADDDVESADQRLRELCDSLLRAEATSKEERSVLGMDSRALLRDVVLPVVAANIAMQRVVTEYADDLEELLRREVQATA